MGRVMSMTGSTLVIPKSKQKACLKAINALHTPKGMQENEAVGGTWVGKEQTSRFYSWVSNPPKSGFKTLGEALLAWRFNSKQTKKGLKIVAFSDGKQDKQGQEMVLFYAIAPFATGTLEFDSRGTSACLVFKNKNVYHTEMAAYNDGLYFCNVEN